VRLSRIPLGVSHRACIVEAMSEPQIRVTSHALRRARERLGATVEDWQVYLWAEKALTTGLPREKAHGELRGYLDGRHAAYPNDYRVLEGRVFAFALGATSYVLLTILDVPESLLPEAAAQQQEVAQATSTVAPPSLGHQS
jgi:hypothetical protein